MFATIAERTSDELTSFAVSAAVLIAPLPEVEGLRDGLAEVKFDCFVEVDFEAL